ncbi:MAG: PorV/PorQ family protein [Calditrichaeota bacterium]|nr:PorV/PorQ family protein [Calditrichota bacterium]
MNRSSKFLIFLIAGLIFFVMPAKGEELKKIAQTGMKWLSIPIGARASSLGGAFTALSNDASSIFWNPAGLALTRNGHAFLTQTQWIADINVNAGVVSYNFPDIGVIGVSFSAVDWGDFHGTRRTAAGFEETGAFSPTNWFVGLGYARSISDRFSIGGHLKYLYEKLGTQLSGSMDNPEQYTAEMNLMAFDIGTIYYTGFRDLRFAMSLQNFSQERKYRVEHFPLPLTFKFGMAMNVTGLWIPESDHGITFAVDALHPRDYSERLHFGLEYSFKEMVFLRGGYKTNYDVEDLTLGGGILYGVGGMAFALDYCYQTFKYFDDVHMFSFDFQF